jgi:phosphatidate cytidylyltransferase
MLITRILTALVLLPLAIGALLYLPNRYWAALLLAVLLAGSWEWSLLARLGRAGRWGFAGIVLASCLALLVIVSQPAGPGRWFEYGIYWIAAAFWVVLAPAWLAGRWRVRGAAALGVTGWIVLVPTWLALVQLQQAAGELLMLIGIVWVADTAAYLVGRRLGRHKLAPEVSPGKTWEGVFGALAAVALYHLSLRSIVGPDEAAFLRPAGLVLFLLLAAASIVGDLFESWIKRQAGVKDSGTLLPGHGGVLDRIDALTSAMPLAALALLYLK